MAYDMDKAWELWLSKFQRIVASIAAKNAGNMSKMWGGAAQDLIEDELEKTYFKAVEQFDENGGAAFNTYATTAIHNSMKNLLESANTQYMKKIRSVDSLSQPIGEDGDETLDAVIGDIDAGFEKFEDKRFMEQLEQKLSPDQWELVQFIIKNYQGKTSGPLLRAIQDKYGVSRYDAQKMVKELALNPVLQTLLG